MWKFAVPGGILCLLGVAWSLQGLGGKTSSGGMNGHPIWAVVGAVVFVAGAALVVVGRRLTSRERT
jgi:hypothetical protein